MSAAENRPGRSEAAPLDDDGRALHRCEYHILLVTRRRKALFADEAMRARCRELLLGVLREYGCRAERLTVHPSTVTLHVFAPPTLSPHMLVHKLQEVGRPLRAEFPAVARNGGVFIRRYIATTSPTPEGASEAFVAQVPRR